MSKKITSLYILVTFFVMLTYVFLSSPGDVPTFVPSATNGVIETSQSSESKHVFPLNGEWEFYWQEFLTPEDLKENLYQPAYIQVPSSWEGTVINKETLSKYGFGTYRLNMKISSTDIGKNKILYLRHIGSAYEIWIDGVKKESIGVKGTSFYDEIPKLRLNVVHFEPIQDTVEIVIQVSNFSFREAGIFGEVSYGDLEAVTAFVLRDFIQDLLLIGGFFFVGLFHLIIFIVQKQERSSILIGLVGIFAALRTLFLNEYIVFILFENISWSFMVRTEYLLEVAGFLSIVLLMNHMYPKEVQAIALKLAHTIAFIFTGYFLFAPTQTFTNTMLIHVIIMVTILFYFVLYVGIIAVIRRREGAFINLLGLIILIAGACNDALYYTNVANTGTILEYCVFLFFMLQAIIISYRNSLLFQKNHMLTLELVQLNNSLEEKVNKRTEELKIKNKELSLLASLDGLTGVYNRSFFLAKVKEFQPHEETALSLILLDIDNFKKVNDDYGHPAGDQVLIEISNILKSIDNAIIGRMGGEEFAVFITELGEPQILDLLEELRDNIAQNQIFIEENKQISVTVSIGVIHCPSSSNKNIEELYKWADIALYESKVSGKNKVTLKSSSSCINT